MNRLLALLLVCSVTACGDSPDVSKNDDAGVIVIAADFSSAYRGRAFGELYDTEDTVLDRIDAEVTVEVEVDPSGRVLLEGLLGDCAVWLDPAVSIVPSQRCVNDQSDVAVLYEVTGSWRLEDDLLTVDLTAHISSLEVPLENRIMKKAFSGFSMSESRGPDVVDSNGFAGDPDDPALVAGECVNNADCRADQECTSGVCLDLLSCPSVYGAARTYVATADWGTCSDGKAYVGVCTRAEDGGPWHCSCEVNDITVGGFDRDSSWEPGFEGARHREFNAECGWLVPELYF